MPDASTPACKICGTRSAFLDRCDFHQNARLHHGFFNEPINPSGLLLDYFRCAACGFVFTGFMDEWDAAKFGAMVYNQDYPAIDGSYNGTRSGGAANSLYLAFREFLPQLGFLDYGGGTGLTAEILKAFGARRAVTWDPFASGAPRPLGVFHVVTAFEVLEHAVNPRAMVDDWVRFIDKEDGIIIFGTNLLPDDIETQKSGWWYMAPRVGHVSFYTPQALGALFGPHGMRIVSLGDVVHFAFKRYPLWARNLLHPQQLPAGVG